MRHPITDTFYLEYDQIRKGNIFNGLGLVYGSCADPEPIDVGKWNVVRVYLPAKSKSVTKYELVASCTSKAAAEAAIRLLSYLEMNYL